jgi:hypothetical protein
MLGGTWDQPVVTSGIATCSSEEWSPSLVPGSITLTDFTYTLTFTCFTRPAITITGP